MNTQKKERSKSLRLMKAVWGCTILCFLPACIVTWMIASFSIDLTRTDGRVDATVSKNILLLVPFSTQTATHITDLKYEVLDGGLIREGGSTASKRGKVTGEAEDEGHLLLISDQGDSIELYVSPKNLADVTEELHYFIRESKEPQLHLWVTSNWKFGVILPGVIFLFGVLALLSTIVAIIMNKPIRAG